MTHSTSESCRHGSAAGCCDQPLCADLSAASQAPGSGVPAALLIRNRCEQVGGIQHASRLRPKEPTAPCTTAHRTLGVTPACRLLQDPLGANQSEIRSTTAIYIVYTVYIHTNLVCRLLGIQPGAEQAEVKSAYRRRALEVHPDVSSASDANERFAEISNAYGEKTLQIPWHAEACLALDRSLSTSSWHSGRARPRCLYLLGSIIMAKGSKACTEQGFHNSQMTCSVM